MTINGRVAHATLMLAIFVGMDVVALGYPFKAALMPLVVGVPGAALCLFQLVTELRRAPAAEPQTQPVKRELQMIAWWGTFIAGILLFGFLIATPILLYAYLRFDSREPRWRALLFALGGIAVVYGIFSQLLSTQLWPGFLPPMVSDLLTGL
jgi:hypothetical protein